MLIQIFIKINWFKGQNGTHIYMVIKNASFPFMDSKQAVVYW